MFQILLAVLLLTSCWSQSCSVANPVTDLIETGKVSLTKRGTGREHCFDLPVGFVMPVGKTNVIVSVSKISGLNTLQGFDFSLTAGRKSPKNIGINAQINEDSSWQSIDISYLVSSREDLLLGSFVTNLFPSSSCSSASSPAVAIDTYISPQPNFSGLKIKTFISGIRTSNPNIDTKIVFSSFEEKSGKIEIQLLTPSRGIELIFFSYVIYPEKHEFFTFRDSNALANTYSFEGVNSISSQRLFLNNVLTLCKKIPSQPNQTQCGDKERKIDGQCQCIQGYTKVNNKCYLLCGINSYADSQYNCICLPGMVRNSYGQCQIVEQKENEKETEKENEQETQREETSHKESETEIKCGENEQNTENGCQCLENFARNSKNECIEVQNCTYMEEYFNVELEQCECKEQFIRVGHLCVERCGVNQKWQKVSQNEGKCICAEGYIYINYACRPCPEDSKYVKNISKDSKLEEITDSTCVCPENKVLSSEGIVLECVYSEKKCQEDEHEIDGKCLRCENGKKWDGKECVCENGGYDIEGHCEECPLGAKKVDGVCQCSNGFYKVQSDILQCKRCHNTCSECTDEGSDKCTACADITFTLSNGYCTKDGVCPPGNYLDEEKGRCASCSDYCNQCDTASQCSQCAEGFSIEKIQEFSYCVSVCGDGRKVDIEQCDDGNLENGDGCDQDCKIEEGWSCSNGSTVKASVCVNDIPKRSVIEVKNAVTQPGKVVQGIHLSYIPKCFTDRNCADCFRILDVKVLEGQIPTNVKVTYLQSSEKQFVAEYIFSNSNIVSTVFKYQIRINPNLGEQYDGCFSEWDYAQNIIGVIDSAMLAKSDETRELTLEEVLGIETEGYSPQILGTIFG